MIKHWIENHYLRDDDYVPVDEADWKSEQYTDEDMRLILHYYRRRSTRGGGFMVEHLLFEICHDQVTRKLNEDTIPLRYDQANYKQLPAVPPTEDEHESE